MNFGLFTVTVLCTAINFISAIEVGDFVVISGLISKPEYNGSIALVQSVGERCLLLKADDQCLRTLTPEKDINECMVVVSIKEANLTTVDWKIPEKLSLAQMVANYAETGKISLNTHHELDVQERENFDQMIEMMHLMESNGAPNFQEMLVMRAFYSDVQTYIGRTISQEEKEFLNRIVLSIRALCQDEPSKLRNAKIAEKVRLIGAWINQNYDFHAMVYVNQACEHLMESITQVWDRIGIWTKDEAINVYM